MFDTSDMNIHARVHRGDTQIFLQALALTLALFIVFAYSMQAYATGVTLTVTVATSLTFSVTTPSFSTQTPGTSQIATTSLSVTTNDANGWIVTLSGDNKTTANNNLETAGNAASIADQTEWVPGAATSTAGNATSTANFTNSGNVLAFRVMTASSSNGTVFYASSWWGTDYSSGAGLWGGIASSTVQRQIGNAGAGSYTSSVHVNTVQYYLNVGASQQTGTYTAPITYTATGN